MRDLLKGYDSTATAYEAYAEAFHKGTKGFSDLVGIDSAAQGISKIEKQLDADLKKKCDKIGKPGR